MVDVVVVDVVDVVEVVVIVFKKLVYTDLSVDLKCCDLTERKINNKRVMKQIKKQLLTIITDLHFVDHGVRFFTYLRPKHHFYDCMVCF